MTPWDWLQLAALAPLMLAAAVLNALSMLNDFLEFFTVGASELE